MRRGLRLRRASSATVAAETVPAGGADAGAVCVVDARVAVIGPAAARLDAQGPGTERRHARGRTCTGHTAYRGAAGHRRRTRTRSAERIRKLLYRVHHRHDVQ